MSRERGAIERRREQWSFVLELFRMMTV